MRGRTISVGGTRTLQCIPVVSLGSGSVCGECLGAHTSLLSLAQAVVSPKEHDFFIITFFVCGAVSVVTGFSRGRKLYDVKVSKCGN